jgi:glycerol-3-phosphate acyltransferase PlsY
VAAATFPLAVWILLQPPWPVWGAALVAAAFIIHRHRSNIERLRSGSEHVFQWGAKR